MKKEMFFQKLEIWLNPNSSWIIIEWFLPNNFFFVSTEKPKKKPPTFLKNYILAWTQTVHEYPDEWYRLGGGFSFRY
jgi:hypothetical protein